jgi:hypothetical protein
MRCVRDLRSFYLHLIAMEVSAIGAVTLALVEQGPLHWGGAVLLGAGLVGVLGPARQRGGGGPVRE